MLNTEIAHVYPIWAIATTDSHLDHSFKIVIPFLLAANWCWRTIGKFVVDIDKNIDINDVTPNCRVALRNDSYTLHKILPNKVDPLVSLMMVEKVPDSTYEMVGGLDKQIKEIKEVSKKYC